MANIRFQFCHAVFSRVFGQRLELSSLIRLVINLFKAALIENR